MAILKLYELRRETEMRRARRWYFTEFAPESAAGIAALVISGERASAAYRTVTSYWDMACSFVNNGAIDEKLFLDANTEHVFIFIKIQPYLSELRELFGNPDYILQLEQLVTRTANFEESLEKRRKLLAYWTVKPPSSELV